LTPRAAHNYSHHSSSEQLCAARAHRSQRFDEVNVHGIDIHAHGVPRTFLEEAAVSRLGGTQVERGEGRYVVTFPGHGALRPVAGIMLDFSDRLAWLDDQGMEQQLIAPWLDVHGQELSPEHGRDWVRLLNDAMADAVASSGGRLHAHATLHMGDAPAAADELARAAGLGMTGCMLPTFFPGGDLDEPRYDAIWEAASSLRIPVVLHPTTDSPTACMFDAQPSMKGLYGRTIDTTVAATRLIAAGVFDRFPDLRLVLVHGGGFLPYQTGRLDRELASEGRALPSEHVRRFFYDTVLMSPEALRFLFDLVGAGRVVIGSDYGAGPKERSGVRLTAALEATGVDEPTRELVMRDNAAALFRLGAAR
jgi:aminocarboxymuconate-semialdehyde decarboxylase